MPNGSSNFMYNPLVNLGVGLLSEPTMGAGLASGMRMAQMGQMAKMQNLMQQQQLAEQQAAENRQRAMERAQKMAVPFLTGGAQGAPFSGAGPLLGHGLPPEQQGQYGIGLLAESGDPRAMEMLMQKAMPSAMGPDKVHSQFISDEGYIGYLTSLGDTVVTKQKVKPDTRFYQNAAGLFAIDPNNPKLPNLIVSPQQIAEGAQITEAATKRGQVTAETQALAERNLPNILSSTDMMRNTINELIRDPGISYIYGTGRADPRAWMPGGPAARAEALRAQLEGQAFTAVVGNIGSMAGLTREEGNRLLQGYTTAIDKNIGTKDAIKAWERVLNQLDAAEERAYAAAGQKRPKPETLTLPPTAISKLRQGVNTTFGNGQIWTLGPDGQPMRVK